jgi:hypothetical protein
MSSEEFVAVALLTQPELDVLGTGFRRAFPLNDITEFTELLGKIDDLTASYISGALDDSTMAIRRREAMSS